MMNLNQFDFINFSLMELGKIGEILREEEQMTDESSKLLSKYVMHMLIEKNEDIESETRIRLIKKILYTLGKTYSEFHTIYAMIDQEYDEIENGD